MPTYAPPGPMPPPIPPPPPLPPGQNGNPTIPAIGGFNSQSQTLISPPAITQSTIIATGTIVGGQITTASTNDSNQPAATIPSLGTPSQQTPSAHPCQSGGDCGCGGKCKDKSLKVEPETISNATRDFKSNPLTTEEVRVIDELCGNTFTAGPTPTKGEIITVKQSRTEMLVSVRRTDDASISYERIIPRTSIGWDVGGKIISFNTPQLSFGLATFIALMGQRMIAMRLGIEMRYDATLRSMSFTRSGSQLLAPPSTSSIIFPNCEGECAKEETESGSPTLCIPHDLVCTVPSWIIPDGQHLSLWWPPVGHVEIDLSQCCLQHDISWWCSQTAFEVANANAKVSSCIAAALYDATNEACDKLSCGGFWRFFCQSAVDLCKIAAALTTGVLDIVEWLLVDIGLGAAAIAVYMKDHLQYFDLCGCHQNSCLCGGTQPTIQCPGSGRAGSVSYTPCDDICTLAQKSGVNTPTGGNVNEVCNQCGWVCNPDGTTYFDYGPNNSDGSNCCPDTTQQCTQQTDAPQCTASCFDCSAICNSSLQRWQYITDPGGQLPCCIGTPPVPQGGEWCFGHLLRRSAH